MVTDGEQPDGGQPDGEQPDGGQPGGGPATPADLAQVQALASALLDGRLDEAGRDALERLVVRHRVAAREYLRSVHLSCVLQLHMRIARLGSTANLDADDGDSSAAEQLHETMVLPAIRDAGAAAAEAGPEFLPAPAPVRPRATPPRRPPGRWSWAAAAVVVGGLTLTWAVRPRRPAAVVTATAAASAPDGSPVLPRTPLAAGESLRLASGAIEVTFDSGTVVVVRGPALVRVVDGNALALASGSATAHVPPPAVGFRVEAPGLSVVDRGTDFGVRVTAADTGPDAAGTDVDVLAGRVDATAVDAAGRPRAAAARVEAGHAVRQADASPGVTPVAVPFAPAGFDLNIATVRIPVPTHGTGVGVAAGAADPNWLVTPPPTGGGVGGVGVGPAGGPVPAFVVVDPLADYAANGADVRWISTTARAADASAGRYVYHTTVDLTGFDPATVAASARAAADDQVAAIAVNGGRAAASGPTEMRTPWWAERHALAVVGQWHEGINQVDVLVDNFPGRQMANRAANFSALQFVLDLSAVPVVRR